MSDKFILLESFESFSNRSDLNDLLKETRYF